MSIRMNPGTSRLTVLGKGWNDNAVIDSGDGFTVDEVFWGDDDEIWGGNEFRFTVRITTMNKFVFRVQGSVHVDWGDGTSTNISASRLYAEYHIYYYGKENTEYTVSIVGDLQNISFCNYDYRGQSPDYSYQLVSSVLTPFPASMGAVENFDNLFHDCYQLTSLPKALFKNCPNAKSFRNAFAGTRERMSNGAVLEYYMKLTELPEDLFSCCPLAEDFADCFSMCRYLTSLPDKLFANLSKARSFAYCFQCCKSLTAIPEGLFADSPQVKSFAYCFYDARKLLEIPEGLFRNNPHVTSFACCFAGDSFYAHALQAVPSGLFANNHAVTTFEACFRHRREIISSLPELWETHSGANGSDCFYGCKKAENYASVPEGWK